jgi:beta-glucosidase
LLSSQSRRTSLTDSLRFPRGFSFGTSTAAWQIEKDVEPSNWTLFEKQFKPGSQVPCAPPHLDACDAIARFDTDLESMQSMNLTSSRFGLSWSALNPKDGHFDSAYLQHYVTICEKLRRTGIEPMITLWHFEIPAWLELEGGLTSPHFREKFKKFVLFAVSGLKSVCRWWFTVNEPSVYATLGYLFGGFPPGHRSIREYKQCLIALITAHADAYHIIHAQIPGAMVSYTKQVAPFQPIHPWSAIEHIICYIGESFFNIPVLDALETGVLRMSFFGLVAFERAIEGLKNSYDYIGVNHYTFMFATLNPWDWGGRSESPVFLSNYAWRFGVSDFGWTLVPESLALTMRWVNARWNPRRVQMVVPEHGISDAKDDRRPEFVEMSLVHLKEAIEKYGIPITRYLYWSLVDNYEWASGYEQRFGLVAVDFATQARTHRGSCDILGRIAADTRHSE